jgi:hypothetical protein
MLRTTPSNRPVSRSPRSVGISRRVGNTIRVAEMILDPSVGIL